MHILQRRGWEIPERLVTPEALVMGQRTALAAAGAMTLTMPAVAQQVGAMTPNPKYSPRPRHHAREGRDHLQQLLRIQRRQEPLEGRRRR